MEQIKILSNDGLLFYNALMDNYAKEDYKSVPEWSGKGFMHISTINSAQATLEDLEIIFQNLGLLTVKIELSCQEEPEQVECLGLGFSKDDLGLEEILEIFEESLKSIEAPSIN